MMMFSPLAEDDPEQGHGRHGQQEPPLRQHTTIAARKITHGSTWRPAAAYFMPGVRSVHLGAERAQVKFAQVSG